MFSAHNHQLPAPIKGFEHIKRYWDPNLNLPTAKILPGECYVSAEGEMIVTVLGSCVAACIRDSALKIGGMNHFMLPVQSASNTFNRPNAVTAELCYGNWAMEYLINSILKLGGKRERLEVKVFGGGRVLAGMTNIDVGQRNIEFVLDYLARDQLKIVSQDLGSDCPRKVLYFPDSGAVKMKRLRVTAINTVQQREKAYMDAMRKKPEAGDVELF